MGTLINFVTKYSPTLSSRLQKSAKNARYLSPKIQNELIAINGDLIRDSIVKECSTSLFWSVMVDEASALMLNKQEFVYVT